MSLYLDASALVKRYVSEDGSDVVRQAMHGAEGWFICRIGFIETLRAVTIAGGDAAGRAFRREWPAFGVVEVDERLTEHGAKLSLEHGLGSSDALHLAAALVLPATQLAFATWDGRLRTGALAEGLAVLPAAPQA